MSPVFNQYRPRLSTIRICRHQSASCVVPISLVSECNVGAKCDSFALECYVCLGQRTNKDKCIKTTIQCEQEQDACKTQIRWQQPRFWQRVSERYHNISKSCETKARCDAEAAAKGFKCMRDWYRDWDCVECCQGDRCNYYATLGGKIGACDMQQFLPHLPRKA
uniref:Uncharacterized protein n=1 Tax=Magallana gigas TaxID=29159 RepID=K1PWZ5_MAGGI